MRRNHIVRKLLDLSDHATNLDLGKNCTRGAFHCEGYAVKSHYGKPGVVKTQPPLQSKDQYTLDPPPLFHK